MDKLEAPKKIRKLKPKQKAALENWLETGSETFGNLYASCIEAGFRPSYALNISHLRPSWLSEAIDQADFEAKHIKAGIQQLATAAPNSRSPDDTRLKAYELLGKITGIIDNKNGNTTNVIVQPILGGRSKETNPKEEKVIDIDTEGNVEESVVDSLESD